MNPKKSKEIVKMTADELEVDDKLVQKAVSFYYDRVYKAIVSLEHTDIALSNLGTFSVRFTVLKKLIEKNQYYIDNKDNLVFSRYTFYKVAEERLRKLTLLEKRMLDHYERKKEFQINKDQRGSTEQEKDS